MRVPGKHTVHAALIDTAIGPGNSPDASGEACKQCTLGKRWRVSGALAPLAQAPQVLPTGQPCSVQVPSHLGGGQLQVSNRLRVRAQLDLLHEISSAAVLRHHGFVQGPRGCRDRDKVDCLPVTALTYLLSKTATGQAGHSVPPWPRDGGGGGSHGNRPFLVCVVATYVSGMHARMHVEDISQATSFTQALPTVLLRQGSSLNLELPDDLDWLCSQ